MSESTATRTGPSLPPVSPHRRRSPRSAATGRWIARPATGDRSVAARHDDEPVIGKHRLRVAGATRDGPLDLDPAIWVDGRDRPARGRELLGRSVDGGRGLPCDEEAAVTEKLEGQLEEVSKRSHRSRRDGVPPTGPGPIDGKRFGADREDLHAVAKARSLDDGLKEPGLLCHRLDQPDAGRGQGRREGQSREPTAAPEVDQRPDRATLEQRHGEEAVENVADRDLGWIPDGGEVDRRIPRKQETDVSVDRRAGGARQREPGGRKALVERATVRIR